MNNGYFGWHITSCSAFIVSLIMKQAQHCALCNHERRSFETGLTCGLTNEKPSFDKQCETIEFGDKFATMLESKCFDYKVLIRERYSAYTRSVLKLALGLFLTLFSYPIVKFYPLAFKTIKYYYHWGFVVVIAVIGIALIVDTLLKLIDFNVKLREARREKLKIDEVISEYDITYDISYHFSRDEFGHRQVDIKCEIFKP